MTLTKILLSLVLALGAATAHSEPVADASPSLKLYAFDCGRIRFATLRALSVDDGETDVREMSVPCYVIEHSAGRLLWNGGLPSRLAESEGWQGEGMLMRLDRTLADQLADIGLDLGSFNFVAFSHLHFDHVGVANEIAGATLLIQRPEFDAAFAGESPMPGFDRSLLGGLETLDRVLLDGDHDVFGDGAVRLLSAPGHTPGHQVLFVDLAETGAVVLSGDLYHLAISREKRRVPTFNYDREATFASIDRIEAFLEETGAQLWIEHELALFERLEKPPAFHQ